MTTTSQDLLDVLVSEGYNIYTQATSILGSLTKTSSSSPASTSAQTTRSSRSSSTAASSASQTSSASTAASATSSLASSTSASRTASTVAGAAVSSASNAASSAAAGQSNGGGGGSNKLAIILGCVLGALALGLLILAILLCCRRRRRRSREASTRYGAVTPNDEDFESWKHPSHGGRYHSEKSRFATTVPFIGGHHAKRHEQTHHNPFTPVPPPPRRSAPNSRAGLTDGTVPGDDPFLMEKGTGHPLAADGTRSRSGSSKGKDLALGLGGAAVGAAAMRHHHNKKESLNDATPVANASDHGISRKPVPTQATNRAEPWVAEPPPPIHDPGTFAAGNSDRQSFDSARSRPSRDATRANPAFDNGHATTMHPDHATDLESSGHHGHHGAGTTAAALGAGALGGAALAHHHHRKSQDHNRESVISRESQHPTLIASHQHNSDMSKASSSQYSDALPTPPRIAPGLHELPSHIPPTPPIQARHHDTALGAAAPPAAVGSYFTPAHPAYASSTGSRSRSRSYSRSRSRSSSQHRPHSFPEHPDDYAAYYPANGAPAMPPIPSRSPRRRSRVSSDFGGAPEMPISNGFSPRSDSPPYVSKSIVGDNGYPHHNVPRRRSGGEYDYSQNGAMGPQAAPLPIPGESRQGSMLSNGAGPRFPPHIVTGGSGSSPEYPEPGTSSDDSAWRASDGMPGGWHRTAKTSGRNSLDGWGGRSPVSPVESEGYGYGHGHGYDGVGQAM